MAKFCWELKESENFSSQCRYVGLVMVACLSEIGNTLPVYDSNLSVVTQLESGEVTFYGLWLIELIQLNRAEEGLHFVLGP